jgi:hypothetical protein
MAYRKRQLTPRTPNVGGAIAKRNDRQKVRYYEDRDAILLGKRYRLPIRVARVLTAAIAEYARHL